MARYGEKRINPRAGRCRQGKAAPEAVRIQHKGRTFHSLPRTLLWYKLARFYGIICYTQNIPFKRIFLWPIDHDSAGYLTESIASYTDTVLQCAVIIQCLQKKRGLLEAKATASSTLRSILSARRGYVVICKRFATKYK